MSSRLLILLSLLAATTHPALAQDAGGFDAHGFDLTTLTADPRAPLTVERPASFEGGGLYLGGVFEYAAMPLAQYTYVDGEYTGRSPVVDDLFALNASAGIAVWNRLRIGVGLPFFFTSTGPGGVPQGGSVGDLRASAMFEILRPVDAGGFGLGVVPYVVLPTGDEAAFLGQSGLTGGGKLAATWEGESLTLGADVGTQFEPAIALENLTGSDKLQIGGHVGYLLDPDLGVNLEAHVELPFQANEYAGTDLPAEALLSVRKRTADGGHYLLGGALGLSHGASAATGRLFLGGGFGTPEQAKDTDGDGIVDKADACVTEPETMNGYKDEDGCPDALPTIAVTATKNGVAVASARLTVAEGDKSLNGTSGLDPWVVDTLPGKSWKGHAELGACLAGDASVTSNDGQVAMEIPLVPVRKAQVTVQVVDAAGNPVPNVMLNWASDQSECAPAATPVLGTKTAVGVGKHLATATSPGFRIGAASVQLAPGDDTVVKIVLEPVAVKITEKKIELLAPVYFDYDKTSIRADSFAVLDDVLTVLKEHPEIRKVEIGGHTDSDGSAKYNQTLSQGRVDTVRAWLMEKGIEADRLVAKGYGESKPVATNATDDGKAKNRRVEFVILVRGMGDSKGPGPDGKAGASTPGDGTSGATRPTESKPADGK